MASAERIALALLAAGRSTRFGAADKLTAMLGDRPLIDCAASTGREIAAQWHLLVAGPTADYGAATEGYTHLVNPAPETGLASSLRIAAAQAQRLDASALLILLADMPFVSAAHLERIIMSGRRDSARPVFSSTARGVAQPPALFPAICFSALQSLDGDQGARALAGTAIRIEADDHQLMDIDTPADLAAANAMLARAAR